MSDVTAIDAMISIHALREEGDVTASAMSFRTWYFYPRPPRGGRPAALRPATPEHWISIHALREEGDVKCGILKPVSRYFYPRPPRGGRRYTRDGAADIFEFLSTPSARRAT